MPTSILGLIKEGSNIGQGQRDRLTCSVTETAKYAQPSLPLSSMGEKQPPLESFSPFLRPLAPCAFQAEYINEEMPFFGGGGERLSTVVTSLQSLF